MAVFLNREGIINHFERIFDEAQREVVMVVPYIRLDAAILRHFENASKKGIEVAIVYRENSLTPDERQKLAIFKNVTLLHHPNVHAKCYLNGDSAIVCSMNLYDHSFKNNREMGVLLDYFTQDPDGKTERTWFSEDDEALEGVMDEVKIIIRASTVDKKSEYVSKNGFKIRALMTKKDHLEEFLEIVNRESENKKFILATETYGDPVLLCENYYENVNVTLDIDLVVEKKNERSLDIRRAGLALKFADAQLENLKKKFLTQRLEFRFNHYKTYWPNGNSIKIYKDQYNYNEVWKKGSAKEHVRGILKGCNLVIDELKKIKEFQKII